MKNVDLTKMMTAHHTVEILILWSSLSDGWGTFLPWRKPKDFNKMGITRNNHPLDYWWSKANVHNTHSESWAHVHHAWSLSISNTWNVQARSSEVYAQLQLLFKAPLGFHRMKTLWSHRINPLKINNMTWKHFLKSEAGPSKLSKKLINNL